MQQVTIQTKAFFEMIKSRDLSMWEVLGEMIDGEAKKISFVDESGNMMMEYLLPTNKEQLQKDQKEFADLLKGQLEKIKEN